MSQLVRLALNLGQSAGGDGAAPEFELGTSVAWSATVRAGQPERSEGSSATVAPLLVSPVLARAADQPCPAATGTIALTLRCHGSGTPETRRIASAPFTLPELAAGAETTISGTLALPPEGPPSYCGEHVKVDWLVSAEIGGSPASAVRLWARPRKR